jgi:hypothetical protein
MLAQATGNRRQGIAEAAVFLAFDGASFINRLDLVVDGGLSGGRQWAAQRQNLQAPRAALANGED